jgi:hypothetical protein
MLTDDERRLYAIEPSSVEDMIAGLADQIADLRTLIVQLREDVRAKPVVELPPRALRFSR